MDPIRDLRRGVNERGWTTVRAGHYQLFGMFSILFALNVEFQLVIKIDRVHSDFGGLWCPEALDQAVTHLLLCQIPNTPCLALLQPARTMRTCVRSFPPPATSS